MLRAGRVWLAGFAVVAVVLASRVSAADPKYFPSDTEIVFTINVRQILDSELAKSQKDLVEQIKKKAQAEDKDKKLEQVQKYLEMAGFDPSKDFNSLTFAMPPSKERENFFMLVDGNFDANKIEAAAKAAAAGSNGALQVVKIGKKYLSLEITPPSDRKFHAVLLNSTTLVVCATEEGAKNAIARAAGTKKSKLKPELVSLLRTTSDKQSLSFVATGSGLGKLANEVPNGDRAVEVLKQISGVSGAVTITKDIKLQIAVGTQDADTAKKFAALITQFQPLANNFIAQAAAQNEKLLPLADAAKTLRATSMDNNLIIRGELSNENIQKLLKNVEIK